MVQAILEKSQNVDIFVRNVKKYISENECKELALDISHLNFIDAGKASALCSAYHWSKYPDGEFTLKTKNSKLIDFLSHICLGKVKVLLD